MILERIRSGIYPVGHKLPSVRIAAQEFDVHANTVSRVYNVLASEQILRTVHGKGTFVIRLPAAREGVEAAVEVAAALRDLAVQSRRLGLTRKEFSRLAADAESASYEALGPSIWFVECSIKDAEELAGSLGTILDRSIRPMLTTDLPHHLMSDEGGHSFFITTPFHVDEVEELVSPRHPVVNVNLVPTSDTLVRLARIEPSAQICVVASNNQTLKRLVHMVRTYTRIEPTAAVLADSPGVEECVQNADIVIDSQSIHGRVMGWQPSGTILTVRFQIEPTSVAYLREVLLRRDAKAI